VTTNAMTDMDIRKRLDHLGFTETAARLLQSLKPWAEDGGIKAFAKECYDRQFVNPDFVAIIRGNNSSQAVLEGAQADYAMDLSKGYPGAAYVNKRANIGKLHARINITPEWYIAFYQFYYDVLYPMIRQQFSGEEESGEAAVAAVNKLLVFDQAVIMDTYVGRLTEQLKEPMDRVGAQIGGTVDQIAAATNQLSSAAEEAGSASQGIATVSQTVADGAQSQAQRTDEITAAMNQLTDAITAVTIGSQDQAVAVERTSALIKQAPEAAEEVAKSAQEAAAGSGEAKQAAIGGKETVAKDSGRDGADQ